ncbi:hypothetical protein JOM56_012082 [Amanita muscaria]
MTKCRRRAKRVLGFAGVSLSGNFPCPLTAVWRLLAFFSAAVKLLYCDYCQPLRMFASRLLPGGELVYYRPSNARLKAFAWWNAGALSTFKNARFEGYARRSAGGLSIFKIAHFEAFARRRSSMVKFKIFLSAPSLPS